jgi:hypothetical protein
MFQERGDDLKLAEDSEEGAEMLKQLDLTNDNDLTSEIVDAIKCLWADPAVQIAYERRNEFQVPHTHTHTHAHTYTRHLHALDAFRVCA